MCATCVAQGVVYLGGAVGSLRVMAARAEARRSRPAPPPPAESDEGVGDAASVSV
jgi:hypothetical protein